MSEQVYEHHLSLKQNKLCPFKIESSENLRNSTCNWHTNIEILLVTNGEGHIQYNSSDLKLNKHCIVVVNSGDLHRICSERGISFYYMIIEERFCRENGIHTAERRFEHIFECDITEQKFLHAHQTYQNYKNDPSPLNTARLRHTVLDLLIDLYEDHSYDAHVNTASERSPRDYVKNSLDFLAEHFTEPLTLEAVAEVCGITKFHLSREFKRYTGQTVITYINILRCKKAEACLSNGMTVTEAACESGFDSISYFSRTYKKLMGSSPSSQKRN